MPGARSGVEEFDRKEVMIEPDGVVETKACSCLEQAVDGDVGERAGEVVVREFGVRNVVRAPVTERRSG